MFFIGKIISPIIFGFATSRYAKEDYEKAAELYEKAIALDPKCNNIEYSYIYLGRCYKEIGKYSIALEFFSKSYEIYIKEKPKFKNAFQKKEVKDMLTLYRSMLKGFDQKEKAREVEAESKKLGIELDDENNSATSYHILPK